eukprot:m.9828 g.9828  ORF g.9828 m.9828 type:complete len:414 (-) comp4142_c0_seq1:732-1973(-)
MMNYTKIYWVFALLSILFPIVKGKELVQFGPPEAVQRLEDLYKDHEQWDPKVEPLSDDRFGFYIHVYNDPVAVTYMVQRLSIVFPTCPVYIMSDGGLDFTDLCVEFNCTFKLCPPANDRWHPWPFLRRMWDAAVHLNREYLIMLEPDNTIHHKIYAQPDHDGGGLKDANPGFGHLLTGYAEILGNKHREFHWDYIQSGLAGGAYFRTAAILDAFSDAAVASLNWTYFEAMDSKRVYSSDFGMPIVLSARGYRYGPWREIGQYDLRGNFVTNQPRWAAFQHYGRGVKGGKPTYNLRFADSQYNRLWKAGKYRDPTRQCQRCYTLEAYQKQWGTSDCTNRLAPGYVWPVPTGDEIKAIKAATQEMMGGSSGYSKYVQSRNQRVGEENELREKIFRELEEKLYNGPDLYKWSPTKK